MFKSVANDIEEWLRAHSVTAAAAAIVAIAASAMSFFSSIGQIGEYFGWQRKEHYAQYVGNLLGELGRVDGGVARKKWTIDKLLMVAASEEGEQAVLCGRLADYVRESSQAADSGHFDWPIIPKERAVYALPKEIEYAVQVLGNDLRGKWGTGWPSLDLRCASLPEAFLQNCEFVNVGLADANLFRASIIGAHITHSDLSGVVLNYCTGDAGTRFDHSSVQKAHFVGADLKGASFQHTQLDSAFFTNADLRKANFTGATGFEEVLCWQGAKVDLIIGSPEFIEWVTQHSKPGSKCAAIAPSSSPCKDP